MTVKPGAPLWLFLCVLCPIALRAAPRRVTFLQAERQVEVYDYVEVKLTVEGPDVANPFTDAFVEGDFGVDGDESVRVDGFCDSDDGSIFRIRFMPTRAGEYVYQVKYNQGPLLRRRRAGLLLATQSVQDCSALMRSTRDTSFGREPVSTISGTEPRHTT